MFFFIHPRGIWVQRTYNQNSLPTALKKVALPHNKYAQKFYEIPQLFLLNLRQPWLNFIYGVRNDITASHAMGAGRFFPGVKAAQT
jgi:hypothetical protein